MVLGINSKDIIDTTLDVSSNLAEHELKKSVKGSKLTNLDYETVETDSLSPNVSTPEPQQSTFQKIDNLGQDLYRDYGRFRDHIDNRDTLHATKTGLKAGKDLIGGNIGSAMKIGSNSIELYDAIKDGNWGKATRLGFDILKDGAQLFVGASLSTKEQMMYDHMCSGLNNIYGTNRVQQHIKNETNDAIAYCQEYYQQYRKTGSQYHEPTRLESLNAKVNEMRAEMKQDAENMPTPEQYIEQRYASEQTLETPTDINTVAVADTKEITTPQALNPTQMMMLNKGGRN